MGIGHIFKIDDRYTNIDRWSIISDNYLLNVLTDYNYSDEEIKHLCSRAPEKYFTRLLK
jgi:hypothetical protein